MFQKLYYLFNQNHKKICDELRNRNEFLDKELHLANMRIVDALDKNQEMRKEIKRTLDYATMLDDKYNKIKAYATKEMTRTISDYKLIAGDAEELERLVKDCEKQDLKIAYNHKKYLLINKG